MKKRMLEKLENAINMGLVDEDIIPMLRKINSCENYFTTSSCSGRIVVIVLEDIGIKFTAEFLGKWHREVTIYEVCDAIDRWNGKGYIFLMMQSPIIHVRCRDEESALKLLRISNECGFKYSSIKSKFVVEILSTEQLHVPLGKDCELWTEKKYLERCVEIANKMLRRAKEKLARLENHLMKILHPPDS